MTPFDAPSGSMWEMSWSPGGLTLFIVLDGHTPEGGRRVAWLRATSKDGTPWKAGRDVTLGNVRKGSRVDVLARHVA